MVKICFFIAPSGPPGSEVAVHSENVYQRMIFPACRELGLESVRSNPSEAVAPVTQQSLSLVIDADVVIADLTNNHPHVLYELGVRQALGKPVILIAREGESIPFDIVTYGIVFFRSDAPGYLREARGVLIRTLEKVMGGQLPASPAFDARATFEPPKEDLFPVTDSALLRGISQRLASLEEGFRTMASHARETGQQEITRDIFIVHGHDGELKNELARFLEKLDFNPIILHERPDRGLTIVQKLQYEASRVSFAFILHTPDDEGRKRGTDDSIQPRSRQNVVFEHGMFVGQFSAGRVCAIVREGVEIPSDLTGVIYKYIPKGSGISSIALELIKELREAGYVVDANRA